MPTLAFLAALAVLNPTSGLERGEYVVAFEPHHVTGPFAGTETCPVCTFPSNPAVMVWVRDESDRNLRAIAETLEHRVETSNRRLQGTDRLVAFLVFLESPENDQARLTRLASEAGLHSVSLALLSPSSPAVTSFEINLGKSVRTTTLVYREAVVQSNFVNLTPSEFGRFESAIDEALGK